MVNGNRCQMCQHQAAKIHITQIHGEEIHDLHLCPECAKNQGLYGPTGGGPASLAEILGSGEDEAAAPVLSPDQGKTCPVCRQTFRGFRDSGRLGCPQCYEVFREELEPLLRKVQMGTVHHGKIPSGEKPKENFWSVIQEKREELKKAVASENFESAARLRDEIRELEENQAS